jgi:hypothetical protein
LRGRAFGGGGPFVWHGVGQLRQSRDSRTPQKKTAC